MAKSESTRAGSGAQGKTHEERLENLVFELLERVETSGPAALEVLCRQHPDLAPDLRKRVAALRSAGLMGEADADQPFPEKLGDFRLLERLGGGGMGVVYLARQESLGREVALKLVRPEQLYFPGARNRFQREVALAARLQHENIVPVYTVGEEQGIPFFAMERVHGPSLGEVLRALEGREPAQLRGRDLYDAVVGAPSAGAADKASGTMAALFTGSWVQAVLLCVRQAAAALEHAHARGVLHRDVKPSNLMITSAGRVLLADFGLASHSESSRLTRTGSQLGSLPYMAPEQLRGEVADARTDLYALAVTLFELLCLRQPYWERAADATRAQILAGEAPSLRRYNSAVPVDLEIVCLKAMDRDPARRYPSATDFARDLDNILEHRPIEARRASGLLRARRWGERHPTLSVGLSLGGLALVVGSLLYALQQASANRKLEVSFKQAVAAQKRAEDSQVEALAARALAEDNQQRAERNFSQALEAVDQMLLRVGEDSLAEIPHMEQVRRELLEDALAFYQHLAVEREGDPRMVRELAGAQRSVGSVLHSLGRLSEAQVSTQKQVDALHGLLASGTGTDQDRIELARGLNLLVLVMRQSGQGLAALPLAQESIALLREVDTRSPLERDDRLALAICQVSLGNCLRLGGDQTGARDAMQEALRLAQLEYEQDPRAGGPALLMARAAMGLGLAEQELGNAPAAEDAYRAALDALEPRLALDSASIDERVSFCDLCTNSGFLLEQMGRLGEAEALYLKALDVRRALLRDFPTVPGHRDSIANLELNLGVAWTRQRIRPAEAGHYLLNAADAYRQLVAEQPESSELKNRLGCALSSLGGWTINDGRSEDAIALFEEAIESQRLALATTPGYSLYIDSMGSHWLGLADANLRLGLAEPAVKSTREALACFENNWFWHRVAVGKFLIAADLIEAEGQADQAASWREEAFSTFARSVELGYRDLEDARGEPSLEVLRQDPRFPQLLERIESGAQ